jgi:hypothetical protein
MVGRRKKLLYDRQHESRTAEREKKVKVLVEQGCRMVHTMSYQKYRYQIYFGGIRNVKCLHFLWLWGIFYGHLVYIFYIRLVNLMVIWYILWPFEIIYIWYTLCSFCGLLLPVFGMLCQDKSGNPESRRGKKAKLLVNIFRRLLFQVWLPLLCMLTRHRQGR